MDGIKTFFPSKKKIRYDADKTISFLAMFSHSFQGFPDFLFPFYAQRNWGLKSVPTFFQSEKTPKTLHPRVFHLRLSVGGSSLEGRFAGNHTENELHELVNICTWLRINDMQCFVVPGLRYIWIIKHVVGSRDVYNSKPSRSR